MSIGVDLRFNNRTLSKQSRRTLQAMAYYNTKNQKKRRFILKRHKKNYSNNEKSLKNQRRKRKLFTLKIITTIFYNSTFDFLCQYKNALDAVMHSF